VSVGKGKEPKDSVFYVTLLQGSLCPEQHGFLHQRKTAHLHRPKGVSRAAMLLVLDHFLSVKQKTRCAITLQWAGGEIGGLFPLGVGTVTLSPDLQAGRSCLCYPMVPLATGRVLRGTIGGCGV